MKIQYILDKETKGSYRFKPENPELIGNATLYITKEKCKELNINKDKGFIMEVQING